MSAEFVDTNILVYAHDKTSPGKQRISIDLLERLSADRIGRFSTQVLLEFFNAVTRKLGLSANVAIEILDDLAMWPVYSPSAEDIVDSARLAAKHSLSIWDALIVQSAIRSECVLPFHQRARRSRARPRPALGRRAITPPMPAAAPVAAASWRASVRTCSDASSTPRAGGGSRSPFSARAGGRCCTSAT